MTRGKVTMTAAAVFAIGVAFAAQTTSERAEPQGEIRQQPMWTPGTNGIAAAYESSSAPLAPPP